MKVSYAQNAEDVMLHRALGDQAAGFYVDVGAHDPSEFSVTRFFYDRGWRGINVEPVAKYNEALQRDRPEDFNPRVAAGATAGEQTMFVVADTGLSTFVEEHATAAKDRGFAVARTVVPVRRLDDIIGEIDPPVVHFLKIDVEGAEGEVLRGIGFERFRPWIVLAEATRPGTQRLAYDEWEPLLAERGYAFVWFDGLNRFYVADEKAELKGAFDAPPNVFDGFIHAREHALQQKALACDATSATLRSQHDADRAALAIARAESNHWKVRSDEIDARLQATAVALDAAVAERASAADAQLRAAAALQASEAGRLAAVSHAEQETARAEEQAGRAVQEAARAEENAGRAVQEATRAEENAGRAVQETARAERHALESQRLHQQYAQALSVIDEQALALREANTRERHAAAEHERLLVDLRTSEVAHASLQDLNEAANATIAALHASRSWRLTAPLRAMMRLIGARP